MYPAYFTTKKPSSEHNFWMRKELRLLKVSLKSHSRQSLPFVVVVVVVVFVVVVAVVVRAHNFPSSLVFQQIQVFNEIMLAPNINRLVISRHVFIFFSSAFFSCGFFSTPLEKCRKRPVYILFGLYQREIC